MKRRYPLEALKTVRDRAVSERISELSEQVTETAERRAALARAEERRRTHEERVRDTNLAERDRVEAGLARAADLQARAAWERGQNERLDALASAERDAARASTEAERALADARAEVARARAEAKAVERHRDRFVLEHERREELALEDAIQDVVAARLGRRV